MSDYLHSPEDSDEYWSDEGCYILELANTAADESCSIARARVPVGGSTRPHCLLKTIERYVIVEGSGLVEINGLSAEPVSRYDVVQIPADVSQKITNTGDSDLVFVCVCTPRFRQESYVELD